LEKDLQGMSDEARKKKREQKAREKKTQKGLDSAFKGKRSASATAGMTRLQKARYYETQGAKNASTARRVRRSGTGNEAAARTHDKVAKEYSRKARKLRARRGIY
jgi:hypothetical protein